MCSISSGKKLKVDEKYSLGGKFISKYSNNVTTYCRVFCFHVLEWRTAGNRRSCKQCNGKLAVIMEELQQFFCVKKIYKMNDACMDCNRISFFGNKFLVM
jgi:hypothetical protein